MAKKKEPEISFNWTTPYSMDDELNEEIAHDDLTPTIIEQAKSNGWDADYYNFGKLEGSGTDFFNPSIVQRPDGIWLIARASGLHNQGFMYGQNSIIAFMLDETGKIPKMGKILRWPVENKDQHFEDPRAFYHPGLDQTFVGCCTFLWNGPGDWTGPHQVFGAFDGDWECKKMDYPMVGGNPGSMQKITEHKNYEKNWLWWHDGTNLNLLYKAHPWLVIQFGNRWSERQEFKGDAVTWPNGEIRGGTNPVRVGDLLFTFHHSSLPWKGRYRRYYAGCLAFDANPPFTPRMITYEPLLQGSQNDTWAQHKPLVIFPCGAIYRNEKWLITCGVNDMVSAWVEIPHEMLLKRMQPVGKDDSMIFAPTGLTKEEIEKARFRAIPNGGKVKNHTGFDITPISVEDAAQILLEKRQANAAKARAAKAAKKLLSMGQPGPSQVPGSGGTVVPAQKRRRKRFKRITAESRQKALAEYEGNKSVANT